MTHGSGHWTITLFRHVGNSQKVKRLTTINVIQEVFHVYLNKFEIGVSHLFLIIFSNNKFTLVNLISRNTQTPRK